MSDITNSEPDLTTICPELAELIENPHSKFYGLDGGTWKRCRGCGAVASELHFPDCPFLAIAARMVELYELVGENQWIDGGEGFDICVECYARKIDGCKSDCRLKQALEGK